jgi:acetyltransferase-like isoleucine patch superfamily enzyme
MLGGHIFRSIGKGVKIHPDVRFTYGYNLTIEDNCRIRRGAVLDDGDGELLVPEGTIVEAGRTFSARGNG